VIAGPGAWSWPSRAARGPGVSASRWRTRSWPPRRLPGAAKAGPGAGPSGDARARSRGAGAPAWLERAYLVVLSVAVLTAVAALVAAVTVRPG
jgi:hypothetical protein